MEHAVNRYLVGTTGQPLPQRGFERSQGQLVDAQRSRERMARHLLDGVRVAEHDSGLRPAEQLVARERHHIA